MIFEVVRVQVNDMIVLCSSIVTVSSLQRKLSEFSPVKHRGVLSWYYMGCYFERGTLRNRS